MKKPILTFDDAIKGSYPRVTATSGAALVDPNNLSTSSFAYSVEFVDETNGVDVTEYKFTMSYNGGSEVDMPSRTYTSADFTKNADGYIKFALGDLFSLRTEQLLLQMQMRVIISLLKVTYQKVEWFFQIPTSHLRLQGLLLLEGSTLLFQ